MTKKKVRTTAELKALMESELIKEFEEWMEEDEKGHSRFKEYVTDAILNIIKYNLGVDRAWNEFRVTGHSKLQAAIKERVEKEGQKFIDQFEAIGLSDKETAGINKMLKKEYLECFSMYAHGLTRKQAQKDIEKFLDGLSILGQ